MTLTTHTIFFEGSIEPRDAYLLTVQDQDVRWGISRNPLLNAHVNPSNAGCQYAFHCPSGRPITVILFPVIDQEIPQVSLYELPRCVYTLSESGESVALRITKTVSDIFPFSLEYSIQADVSKPVVTHLDPETNVRYSLDLPNR